MGCGDVMTPVLYWATLASGGLLGLGGVTTALTLDPFDIFNGIFSLLFGMMIIGARAHTRRLAWLGSAYRKPALPPQARS